jgi:hypothetical protein
VFPPAAAVWPGLAAGAAGFDEGRRRGGFRRDLGRRFSGRPLSFEPLGVAGTEGLGRRGLALLAAAFAAGGGEGFGVLRRRRVARRNVVFGL